LRRVRAWLERLIGGGGFTPRLIPPALGIVVLAWLVLGVYVVQPAQEAVVTTFGAYSRSEGPGAHWRLLGVENVEKVPVAALNRTDIGGNPAAPVPQESLMLTGDENIVDLAFTVQWRINDPKKYLFQVKDPDDTVKAVAESAIREVIGQTALQDILTTGRSKVQSDTEDLMQHILDSYDAGITVVEVQVRSANPPPDVIPAFQDVASAQQVADSAVNEANAYRNKVVNEAKGDAAKIVQSAQGYREQVVREAQGDADRFNLVYDQYRRAPAVTRERLYIETMERVLSKSNKVIVDTHGATAPIILPPDVFRPRTDNSAQAEPQQPAPPAPAPAPAAPADGGGQ
jgi:membrane protease subunit HflK